MRKHYLIAAVAALALGALSHFAEAQPLPGGNPNCSTNWVGGACGPQSIANAQSTSSITCRDGTVIHFRDDNPRSCPSCEKGRS